MKESMMKEAIGIFCICLSIWAMIYSGLENHSYQYHYDGNTQAIEKNDVGSVLDTEQNRLAVLNNKAGDNHSWLLALGGGVLLAIGLRIYVSAIVNEG